MHSAFYKEKETEENIHTRFQMEAWRVLELYCKWELWKYREILKFCRIFKKNKYEEKSSKAWEKEKRQICWSVCFITKIITWGKWTNKMKALVEKNFVLGSHIPNMNAGTMPMPGLLGLGLSLKMKCIKCSCLP